jgi:hypothetical protein
MKKIASRLKNSAFTEHIEDRELALFREHTLDEETTKEIWKHLSQCQRCRDVLKVASEIEAEEQRLQPINNINYKRFIPLAIASSLLLTAGTLPAIKHFPDEVIFKGGFEEKGFIDKTIYYWECRFNEIFGENK